MRQGPRLKAGVIPPLGLNLHLLSPQDEIEHGTGGGGLQCNHKQEKGKKEETTYYLQVIYLVILQNLRHQSVYFQDKLGNSYEKMQYLQMLYITKECLSPDGTFVYLDGLVTKSQLVYFYNMTVPRK